MSDVQEEAVRAVSKAISSADVGLLAAIDSAQEKWQLELSNAKDSATSMLSDVLTQRESLRSSLSSAARLWHVLKPNSMTNAIPLQGASATDNPSFTQKSGDSPFLATSDQMTMVKALQNVSHTIFLMEFIIAAPDALQRAHDSLVKVQDDGLVEVHSGNAALLVDSHAVLTAVERLRDVVLLDAPQTLRVNSPLSICFANATSTRNLLEDIVIRGVFANAIPISQSNPRLLVAAARIVQAEETEDAWWTSHVQRCASHHLAAQVRPYGALKYKQRARDAVIDTLKSVFRKKQNDLGLLEDVDPDVESSQREFANLRVGDILDWIEQRRIENDTVRRFVTPCVPPAFSLSSLYEKELHRQFMRLVTRLLHLVHPDGSMVLSESDLIQLTSWYGEYKKGVREQDEAIDTFLSESDRRRIITALGQHCYDSVSLQIKDVLTKNSVTTLETRQKTSEDEKHTTNERNTEEVERQGLWLADLPDIVFDCVKHHVRSMLSLRINGLSQAIVQAVVDSLAEFQDKVREIINEQRLILSDDIYGLYLCAVANNMARCLEYSEDMRDMLVQLIPDGDRSIIEDMMETVIEGFRMTASTALHALINEISGALYVHANRFYEPHTGTEIMLDIVATLEDYFSEYEVHLLPFHFEYLAIENLRRVVVCYLAPFLRLCEHKDDESVARRFTSLPTFDEVGFSRGGDTLYDFEESHELSSRRSENDRNERRAPRGLGSMSADAVVAQIDKDLNNVTRFMRRKVVLYQKKQLEPTLEPIRAIRSIYDCVPTAFTMMQTYREAKQVINRVLRPTWVTECGIEGHMGPRVAEVIWEARKDVAPVVLLEAVTMIRSTRDGLDSESPSRMSSVDDGVEVWGSRTSGGFRESMVVRDTMFMENNLQSLLWTPTSSRSRLK